MRTALYVPGDRPDLLAKALGGTADELIVDLEDAVPVAAKERTRRDVAAWLRTLPARRPFVSVRINPGEPGHADVREIAGPGLDGLCVAKTESAAELDALDAVLTAAGADGLPVVPLLESAAAVLAAPAIARAPRVVRLQLGEADLTADLGVTPGPDESELLWARSQVVAAGAAAGLEPPIGPVSTEFRDLEAFRATTLRLKRLGFHGRACIHPAQLAVVAEVFTPTPAELDRARALLARYETGLAAGSGVFVGDDGRMVDEAVIRAARRLLAH
ncbi:MULTISPECIES: HpcH/HpaI aldolase/citrate lyase family protein [Thermomonosporaceae]|uniref:HpcH/HpaI aldolase/citrate lyase family protein n=1 Tax=Thermomonosporaceae TaxID=2012 RepID=UPI00255A7709|nr:MULTISPECIES: CoA ester lyase [Thermomonosporaceae]MDL4772508.1 CoA ester lyase [Actinomadura xylanilytica]